MSLLRSSAFGTYLVGIGCIAAGAHFSHATGSMWPLAFGSATGAMATWGLVKAVRTRGRRRPQAAARQADR